MKNISTIWSHCILSNAKYNRRRFFSWLLITGWNIIETKFFSFRLPKHWRSRQPDLVDSFFNKRHQIVGQEYSLNSWPSLNLIFFISKAVTKCLRIFSKFSLKLFRMPNNTRNNLHNYSWSTFATLGNNLLWRNNYLYPVPIIKTKILA